MTKNELTDLLNNLSIGMELFIPYEVLEEILTNTDPSIFAIGVASGCGTVKPDSIKNGYSLEKTHYV